MNREAAIGYLILACNSLEEFDDETIEEIIKRMWRAMELHNVEEAEQAYSDF